MHWWTYVYSLPSTLSVPKYKHLLTSIDHIWPFILFKKFEKILFILLWHVLSSYIFEVYLNHFYFFSDFLNKMNGRSAEINKCLYFGTEVVVYNNKDRLEKGILLRPRLVCRPHFHFQTVFEFDPVWKGFIRLYLILSIQYP